MRIVFLQRYSPAKGRVLPAGYVDEAPDEVAIDLIQRGIAAPAQPVVERAVVEPAERRATGGHGQETGPSE